VSFQARSECGVCRSSIESVLESLKNYCSPSGAEKANSPKQTTADLVRSVTLRSSLLDNLGDRRYALLDGLS
jgi:hypothetical protein